MSKAFDRDDYKAPLNALELHGVSDGLISIIKLLYKNRIGRVDDSKYILIDSGGKQSDILLSMLLNTIMHIAMRNWKNQVTDREFLLYATLPELQSTRSAYDLFLFVRLYKEAKHILELL